jgi:hypothetical protein
MPGLCVLGRGGCRGRAYRGSAKAVLEDENFLARGRWPERVRHRWARRGADA